MFRKCRRSHHLVHILIFFLTYGRGISPSHAHPLRTLNLSSGTPLALGTLSSFACFLQVFSGLLIFSKSTFFLKSSRIITRVSNSLSQLTLCMLGNMIFFISAFFFKINFLKKYFKEFHQSIKQFRSRPGSTFCHA